MASTASERPLAVASKRVIDAILSLESLVDHTARARETYLQSQESMQAEMTASWQTHAAGMEADNIALVEENLELKQQNTELQNELHQLRQNYLNLQQAAGRVTKKLDRSIEQLDLILETA
jgi:molecular chaperone GrpE (heat shock protein)